MAARKHPRARRRASTRTVPSGLGKGSHCRRQPQKRSFVETVTDSQTTAFKVALIGTIENGLPSDDSYSNDVPVESVNPDATVKIPAYDDNALNQSEHSFLEPLSLPDVHEDISPHLVQSIFQRITEFFKFYYLKGGSEFPFPPHSDFQLIQGTMERLLSTQGAEGQVRSLKQRYLDLADDIAYQRWQALFSLWCKTRIGEELRQKLNSLQDAASGPPRLENEYMFTNFATDLALLTPTCPSGVSLEHWRRYVPSVLDDKIYWASLESLDKIHAAFQEKAYSAHEICVSWLLVWKCLKKLYRSWKACGFQFPASESGYEGNKFAIENEFLTLPDVPSDLSACAEMPDCINPRKVEDLVGKYCSIIARQENHNAATKEASFRLEETAVIDAWDERFLEILHGSSKRLNSITKGPKIIRRWDWNSAENVFNVWTAIGGQNTDGPTQQATHDEVNPSDEDLNIVEETPMADRSLRNASSFARHALPETRALTVAQNRQITRDLANNGTTISDIRADDVTNQSPRQTRWPSTISDTNSTTGWDVISMTRRTVAMINGALTHQSANGENSSGHGNSIPRSIPDLQFHDRSTLGRLPPYGNPPSFNPITPTGGNAITLAAPGDRNTTEEDVIHIYERSRPREGRTVANRSALDGMIRGWLVDVSNHPGSQPASTSPARGPSSSRDAVQQPLGFIIYESPNGSLGRDIDEQSPVGRANRAAWPSLPRSQPQSRAPLREVLLSRGIDGGDSFAENNDPSLGYVTRPIDQASGLSQRPFTAFTPDPFRNNDGLNLLPRDFGLVRPDSSTYNSILRDQFQPIDPAGQSQCHPCPKYAGQYHHRCTVPPCPPVDSDKSKESQKSRSFDNIFEERRNDGSAHMQPDRSSQGRQRLDLQNLEARGRPASGPTISQLQNQLNRPNRDSTPRYLPSGEDYGRMTVSELYAELSHRQLDTQHRISSPPDRATLITRLRDADRSGNVGRGAHGSRNLAIAARGIDPGPSLFASGGDFAGLMAIDQQPPIARTLWPLLPVAPSTNAPDGNATGLRHFDPMFLRQVLNLAPRAQQSIQPSTEQPSNTPQLSPSNKPLTPEPRDSTPPKATTPKSTFPKSKSPKRSSPKRSSQKRSSAQRSPWTDPDSQHTGSSAHGSGAHGSGAHGSDAADTGATSSGVVVSGTADSISASSALPQGPSPGSVTSTALPATTTTISTTAAVATTAATILATTAAVTTPAATSTTTATTGVTAATVSTTPPAPAAPLPASAPAAPTWNRSGGGGRQLRSRTQLKTPQRFT